MGKIRTRMKLDASRSTLVRTYKALELFMSWAALIIVISSIVHHTGESSQSAVYW